ncbi:hypothetical protein HDU96_006342 [Phlyctochytrium bullatum]|nr:hypothetical protein HDU96_006342 [Phlyctochytrium bullatum]
MEVLKNDKINPNDGKTLIEYISAIIGFLLPYQTGELSFIEDDTDDIDVVVNTGWDSAKRHIQKAKKAHLPCELTDLAEVEDPPALGSLEVPDLAEHGNEPDAAVEEYDDPHESTETTEREDGGHLDDDQSAMDDDESDIDSDYFDDFFEGGVVPWADD